VKDGWKRLPFEDCIERVTYTEKIQRKDFLADGTYPIVSQEEEFINGYWENEADVFRVTTPVVLFGDHTKIFKYVDFDFVLGADGVKILQPRDFLSSKFFYYQLQSARLDSLGYARHYKLLRELEIFYPARAEQDRIVGILDEAFEGLATAKTNMEKNLRNARALFESHLQSIFAKPSENVPLSALAIDITDGDHSPPPKAPTGIPFITISDIVKQTREVDFRDTFMVPPAYFRKLRPNKKPRAGDVLYTVTGATLGIPVLVKEQRDFCFQRHIALIRPKSDTDSSWLTYALLSPQVFRQAASGSTGAAQKTVSLSVLRELKLPKVEFAEQKRIATRLDALAAETSRLATLYEGKLIAVKELKDSLLCRAFAGELTAKSRQAAVTTFPTKIQGITTTDLQAGILARAYELHEKNVCSKHFGHVKAEKIAHMVEAFVGIDLGRMPIKDAAGPNDYLHQQRVEHRARKAGYFDFKRVDGAGYRVKRLRHFDAIVERARERLGDSNQGLDRLLELMLPMNTQQAEIFCTVYAAWNNLLLDGQKPSDEEIVYEARENWHPSKLNIPRDKFFAAVSWLKEKGIVPSGRGKRVVAKTGKK